MKSDIPWAAETHHVRARRSAAGAARRATRALAEMGVTAAITGSLAEGRFGTGSDIDFLITHCPRALKYAIENVVEDCLGGIPFDVIYLDEIPIDRRHRFTMHAIDARDLR